MMIAIAFILLVLYYIFRPLPKMKVPEVPTVPLEHFKDTVADFKATIGELNSTIAYLRKDCEFFEKGLQELKSQQQSKSVRLGQLTESILPLHINFPYDYKLIRPMFQPIDYVYFGQDKIVFIEVKMGTSQLSEKQKNIARLVKEGKVFFEQHRVDEKGYTVK